MLEPKTPWLPNYGDVPFHLTYSTMSMSDTVLDTAERYPTNTALSYMGRTINYTTLAEQIRLTAKALCAAGIKKDQRVTVCMPNVPQTVYCLYALNYIGAVASMVHPLSAVGEIVFYLHEVESSCVITLDQFYGKMLEVQKQCPIQKLIITSAGDELGTVKKLGYKLTAGRKNKVEPAKNVLLWHDFIAAGKAYSGADPAAHKKPNDEAVILFSGGTTGTTKGIRLSNLNFNALALQTMTMCHCQVTGKKMLAAMPMFHGFGLGVCVHTMMVAGGQSILVPRFNVKDYALLIKKNRPNFIAGVPTLFEAITRNPYLDGVSLDCLMGVFSGGDSLSIELKKKFDAFLEAHHATIHVREGYGTTECVTASCLTPYHCEREGSIGFPYPDTYYMICKVGGIVLESAAQKRKSPHG